MFAEFLGEYELRRDHFDGLVARVFDRLGVVADHVLWRFLHRREARHELVERQYGVNGRLLIRGVGQRDRFRLHAVYAGELFLQLVALRDHASERGARFGQRAHAVLSADPERVEPLLLIEQLGLGFFVALRGLAQALFEVNLEARDFVLQRLEAVAQLCRGARFLGEGTLEPLDALRFGTGRRCLRSH